jgi:hypothetical protein
MTFNARQPRGLFAQSKMLLSTGIAGPKANSISVLEREQEWDTQGVPFYWISPYPGCINPIDWPIKLKR